MDFRPIVAPSIRELFIQQVEGAILSGQLKPGDRLPTERELADTMHISKTVVHEGLRELHRLGFLDIASRRGVTVADYAQTGSLETLMAIMDYHGGLPDEKTARSILRLRYYLEAPALRDLAAWYKARFPIPFMQANLEVGSGYIRSVGREESLRTLARFTDRIAAGQGDRAAQLLDDGLRRFVTTL